MLRGAAIVVGILACACTPAFKPMSASQASEHIEHFAAGSSTPDVCTPQGRALLRGAVRAYSGALAQAGVDWPALSSDGEPLRSTDVAIAVAFAAGFVEASDFHADARADVRHFALTHWPQFRDMRAAAHLACTRVIELQHAALRLAAEMDRYRRLMARAEYGRGDPVRLRRQRERLASAQAQVETLAQTVQAEITAARRNR